MNDEEKAAYLNASSEFDSDERDEALWVKALTLSKGDKEAARYEYIRLRVAETHQDDSNSPAEATHGDSFFDRLFAAKNAKWLYWTAVVLAATFGLSPVFANDPEDSLTLFFVIGCVVVAFKFLANGERFRFTSALLLAAILNPLVLEENKYDEEFCSFLSVACSSLLLLLHGRPKYYKQFMLCSSVLAFFGYVIATMGFVREEIDIDEYLGIFISIAVGVHLVIVPLFKHTIFRDSESKREIVNNVDTTSLAPKTAWKVYFIPLVVTLAFVIPARLLYPETRDWTDGAETGAILLLLASISSFLCFTVAIVGFGCFVVRGIQALYMLSAKHLKASLLWLVFPVVHLALTASVVLGDAWLMRREVANADEAQLQFELRTHEKLLNDLERYFSESNKEHLDKWEQSGLYELFDGQMTSAKIENGLIACAEMTRYLKEQKKEIDNYMDPPIQIVTDSKISQKDKDQLLNGWSLLNLESRLNKISEIEIEGLAAIKSLLLNLKNSEWRESEGEYIFERDEASKRHDENIGRFINLNSEIQQMKAEFLSVVESSALAMLGNQSVAKVAKKTYTYKSSDLGFQVDFPNSKINETRAVGGVPNSVRYKVMGEIGDDAVLYTLVVVPGVEPEPLDFDGMKPETLLHHSGALLSGLSPEEEAQVDGILSNVGGNYTYFYSYDKQLEEGVLYVDAALTFRGKDSAIFLMEVSAIDREALGRLITRFWESLIFN